MENELVCTLKRLERKSSSYGIDSLEGSNMEVIVQKAQEKLNSDLLLRSYGLAVGEQDGCVVLDGKVDSYYHKQMAQESIRVIIGRTINIKNKIKVIAKCLAERTRQNA
jgi:hypothetical protein